MYDIEVDQFSVFSPGMKEIKDFCYQANDCTHQPLLSELNEVVCFLFQVHYFEIMMTNGLLLDGAGELVINLK